jgi:hypothetical protein
LEKPAPARGQCRDTPAPVGGVAFQDQETLSAEPLDQLAERRGMKNEAATEIEQADGPGLGNDP